MKWDNPVTAVNICQCYRDGCRWLVGKSFHHIMYSIEVESNIRLTYYVLFKIGPGAIKNLEGHLVKFNSWCNNELTKKECKNQTSQKQKYILWPKKHMMAMFKEFTTHIICIDKADHYFYFRLITKALSCLFFFNAFPLLSTTPKMGKTQFDHHFRNSGGGGCTCILIIFFTERMRQSQQLVTRPGTLHGL